MATNRKGDKVVIPGAYQYNAVHSGNTFQRNWHILKLQAAAQLAEITSEDTLLDVGCGSGILLSFLPHVKSYTGLDANSTAIAFAQKTYPSLNNSFRLFQVDDLHLLESGSYSKIFFLETIEHITEEQGLNTLRQFYRLLKPGGICIISTPNRKSLWPAIEWMLDFFRLTPRMKEEQHEKLYSINELKAVVSQSGLQVKNIKTMNGIAPWLSFLGKKNTQAIHHWEMKNKWFPGSLILMALEKGNK